MYSCLLTTSIRIGCAVEWLAVLELDDVHSLINRKARSMIAVTEDKHLAQTNKYLLTNAPECLLCSRILQISLHKQTSGVLFSAKRAVDAHGRDLNGCPLACRVSLLSFSALAFAKEKITDCYLLDNVL